MIAQKGHSSCLLIINSSLYSLRESRIEFASSYAIIFICINCTFKFQFVEYIFRFQCDMLIRLALFGPSGSQIFQNRCKWMTNKLCNGEEQMIKNTITISYFYYQIKMFVTSTQNELTRYLLFSSLIFNISINYELIFNNFVTCNKLADYNQINLFNFYYMIY